MAIQNTYGLFNYKMMFVYDVQTACWEMLIYVKESVGYKETEFACYLQLPVKCVFWSVLSC